MASVFLPLLFRYFKDVSLASEKPLFQRLLEDPTATSIGDAALIKELTRKVNDDPSYTLPPGFIKFKTQELHEKYEAPSNLKTSHKIALEILDEIFKDAFGIHALDPQIGHENKWQVKADIFQAKKKKDSKASFLKIDKKHTFQPNVQQEQK